MLKNKDNLSPKNFFNSLKVFLSSEELLETQKSISSAEKYLHQLIPAKKIAFFIENERLMADCYHNLLKYLSIFKKDMFIPILLIDLIFYLETRFCKKKYHKKRAWKKTWEALLGEHWKQNFQWYCGATYFEVAHRIPTSHFLQFLFNYLQLAKKPTNQSTLALEQLEKELYRLRFSFPIQLTTEELEVLEACIKFQSDKPSVLAEHLSMKNQKASQLMRYLREDLEICARNIGIAFFKIGLQPLQIIIVYDERHTKPKELIAQHFLQSPWLYSYFHSSHGEKEYYIFNLVVPILKETKMILDALKEKFLSTDGFIDFLITARVKNSYKRSHNLQFLKKDYQSEQFRTNFLNFLESAVSQLNHELTSLKSLEPTQSLESQPQLPPIWDFHSVNLNAIKKADLEIINVIFQYGYQSQRAIQKIAHKKMEIVNKRLKDLLTRKIISYQYSLYPYNLPEMLHCTFECSLQEAELIATSLIDKTFVSYAQLIHGDITGVNLIFSLPRGWSQYLKNLLQKIDVSHKWIVSATANQVTANWRIPIKYWNEDLHMWTIGGEDFGFIAEDPDSYLTRMTENK